MDKTYEEFKKESKNWYTVRFVDKNAIKIVNQNYNYSEYIGNLINYKTKDYIIIDNYFGKHKILKEHIIKIYKFGGTTL